MGSIPIPGIENKQLTASPTSSQNPQKRSVVLVLQHDTGAAAKRFDQPLERGIRCVAATPCFGERSGRILCWGVPGKKFSRFEAWLYIVNVLAAGMDNKESGLRRGEFASSSRYLASKWNWPRTTVQRFFKELESAGMITASILTRVTSRANIKEVIKEGYKK